MRLWAIFFTSRDCAKIDGSAARARSRSGRVGVAEARSRAERVRAGTRRERPDGAGVDRHQRTARGAAVRTCARDPIGRPGPREVPSGRSDAELLDPRLVLLGLDLVRLDEVAL